MPFSTDVRLPRAAVPVFPEACCACGLERPGDRVAYKARRIRWAELFMPWLWFFGQRVTVDVPVCAACRPRVVSGRFWRTAATWAVLIVCLWFLYPWVKSFGLPRTATKVVAMVVVLLGMAPVLVLVALRPPPFDLTVGDGHVDYEFASADYARRFADANPGAVLER